MTSSEGIDCNPGVTRRLKSPPKAGQKSVLLAERFTVVPDSCVALLLSATPSSLPVTPEATGSSPVHPANFLARFRSVPERSPLNARVYGFARFLHRSLERPCSPSAALDFSPQFVETPGRASRPTEGNAASRPRSPLSPRTLVELMRNIQVIDGAANCTYSVFKIADSAFVSLFPDAQDVAFIDEVIDRIGEAQAQRILANVWSHPVLKRSVRGIHGTLFFDLDAKKRLYPTRREDEVDPSAINAAQRVLLERVRTGRAGTNAGARKRNSRSTHEGTRRFGSRRTR